MTNRRAWTRFLRLAHYHGLIPYRVLITGLALVRLIYPPNQDTTPQEQS